LEKLICKILGHKWEYKIYLKGAYKARGCTRCNRREAQIGNISIWQYSAMDWENFKNTPPDWVTIQKKFKDAFDQNKINELIVKSLKKNGELKPGS
jgi:hypothetical protein